MDTRRIILLVGAAAIAVFVYAMLAPQGTPPPEAPATEPAPADTK